MRATIEALLRTIETRKREAGLFYNASNRAYCAFDRASGRIRRFHGVTKVFGRVFGEIKKCRRQRQQKNSGGGSGGGGSSKARGIRVHVQLKELADRIAVDDNALSSTTDSMTRRVWHTLVHGLGWQPVDGEVVVSSGAMATAVDLLCVCLRTGRPKLLEVKTGYGGGGSGYCDTVHGPGRVFRGTDIARTFYNQHSMQLAETARLFTDTYGIALDAAEDLRIVRADEHAVDVLPVAPVVRRSAAQLHRRAADSLLQQKLRRRGGRRGGRTSGPLTH